ncbi:MAG: hypothetical protein QW035_02370 [Candidatus Anstonellales archaeon]
MKTASTLLFLIALLTFAFAQSCEQRCCDSAGGYWDYAEGTCEDPDYSEYFECSLDCDGGSSSSSGCCGSAAILLGIAGAAFIAKR